MPIEADDPVERIQQLQKEVKKLKRTVREYEYDYSHIKSRTNEESVILLIQMTRLYNYAKGFDPRMLDHMIAKHDLFRPDEFA